MKFQNFTGSYSLVGTPRNGGNEWDIDTDGDSLINGLDTDQDGDGLPNWWDQDEGNDGVMDVNDPKMGGHIQSDNLWLHRWELCYRILLRLYLCFCLSDAA